MQPCSSMSTSSQSKHTGLTRQLTKTPSSHTVRHAKPSWAPTIVVIEAPPPYSDSTEASSRSNDSSKLAMPLKSQNNTLPRPFIVDDEKLPLRAAPVHGDPTVSVLNRQEEPIQTTCRLAQHEQSITAGPTRNKKPGQPLRSTVPVHEDPTDALYENATLANPAPPATPSPPPNSVSKHSASPARSAATNCSKPFSPASEATPLAAPPKDEFPKDELCTALDVLSKKPVPGIELVVKGLREVIESCSVSSLFPLSTVHSWSS